MPSTSNPEPSQGPGRPRQEANQAFLILEDGSLFPGSSVGAATAFTWGEVIFNTSMAGYQEMITDPSGAGQILVLTYPLAGNYGISNEANESARIQVRGLVVREACFQPSHNASVRTLDDFLKSEAVAGLSGVDTRALTRKLRSKGVMMGAMVCGMSPDEALDTLRRQPGYGSTSFVPDVSTSATYRWNEWKDDQPGPHIIVVDYGVKYSIMRILSSLGCRTTVVPYTSSAEQVLDLRPDGILLSPGPGNPELLDSPVETVRRLVSKKPIMGICLGEQVLGRVFGGKTFKLKFGHRGGNHPVRDLQTGKVFMTAQNHGFALDGDSFKGGCEVSQVNLNDGTVEGLRHREWPIMGIQYHAEASPGPFDNEHAFESFLRLVRSEHGSTS